MEKTKDVALDSTEGEGVMIKYLLDVQLLGRASRTEVVQPNFPCRRMRKLCYAAISRQVLLFAIVGLAARTPLAEKLDNLEGRLEKCGGHLPKAGYFLPIRKKVSPNIKIIESLAGMLCIAAQIICDAVARLPLHSLIIIIVNEAPG